MTIRREELDAGLVDLADVTTGKRVPPAHPGEILRHDFLEPMGLSVYALANATRMPPLARQRRRPRPPGDHRRHRASARPLLWHDARVLDQPAGALRPGGREGNLTPTHREGGRAPRRVIARPETFLADPRLFRFGLVWEAERWSGRAGQSKTIRH